MVIARYAATHYEDGCGPVVLGFEGFTLCGNLASFEECVAVYETISSVDGVEILGEPQEAFRGGGFRWKDPEGNVWDVAWAKGSTIDERGGVTFP